MIRLVKELHRDSVQEEIDSGESTGRNQRYYVLLPAERGEDGTVVDWDAHMMTEYMLKKLRDEIDDEIDR